ncbi:MAG TPA: hypothetical protein VGN71_02115 [Solirubrobacteraceae bacterium]|nr:hypothetical protein [Solirubrobacteraceae bacterium]
MGTPDSPLDAWLPDPHARTRHVRSSPAPPERLWAAAERVRVRDTVTLRPLIMLRLGEDAPAVDTRFRELFRRPPFVLLEEGERWSASGLAGRLWARRGGLARLERPEEYRAWAKPGTARVALLNAVLPRPGGGSEIVTETRVRCVDRRALIRFRPYWTVMGPFSRFIRIDLLAAAVRRA